MKARELKNRLDKLDESRLDIDIMIDCGNNHFGVLFAKDINYNKRDSKFTPRVFIIQTK